MTKNVLVTVKGSQFTGETDEIETICQGEYFEVKDSRYVVYEEFAEGFEKPLTNRIKINQDEILVTKKGPFQVQMSFETGKKTRTSYITPFGSILLEIDTKSIRILETDSDIRIIIEYGLDANEQFVADCKIDINISSK